MIVMKQGTTSEDVDHILREIYSRGLRGVVSLRKNRTVIGLVGEQSKIEESYLKSLPGVENAVVMKTPYRLISREYGKLANEDSEFSSVQAGNVTIGGNEPVFIAGPCAVENKQQLFKIAEGVKRAGADILRGGIFKPRSSVHSFQGIGGRSPEAAEEALSWLKEAGEKYGLPVITEVRGESQVDLVAKYVDILQIGSRNMYDQDLLVKAADTGKPILLKRHFGAGIEEFLSFAEYIAAEGNSNIILCERGIMPVGKGKSYTRYTFDLSSIPAIQNETYLPVVADPSHATGRKDMIYSMSCAAVAAGASGLMIETHYNPAEAIVDGAQTITPAELKEVIAACRRVRRVLMLQRN